MKRLSTFLAGLLTAFACLSATPNPIVLAGVTVEPTITLAGSRLILNGAGIRYKGPFKVYTGSLYATKRFSSLDELMALPGPKRGHMTMLREVSSAELGKQMTRGIEDNYPKEKISGLIPFLISVVDAFNSFTVLKAGDVILIDWIPGTDMVLTVKGIARGQPFKDPETFRAMMGTVVGPIPGDFKLKDSLLGLK